MGYDSKTGLDHLEQFNFFFIALFNIIYLPLNPSITSIHVSVIIVVIVVVFVAGKACQRTVVHRVRAHTVVAAPLWEKMEEESRRKWNREGENKTIKVSQINTSVWLVHRWRKKKKSISALKKLKSYERNKSYKLGIRKDVSTYLLLHERCVLSGTVRWSVSIQRKHACSVGRHQLIHTWR